MLPLMSFGPAVRAHPHAYRHSANAGLTQSHQLGWFSMLAHDNCSFEPACRELFPYDCLFESLADEALVGDAAGLGARLDGFQQRFREAHVDPRVLPRELEPHGLEL